jgi:hypothetical protein
MKYFFPIIVVSLLSIACNSNFSLKDTDALVRVGGKVLYMSDLEESIPAGLSQEDSIFMAENFIRSWISENLLYNIAERNLEDRQNIERLVENYRKSLIIYQYEEQLVNERLSNEISEQTLYDFYEQNKDRFKIERPLVQGLFLKVPVNAPQLSEIRTWYRLTSPAARENLERNSLSNAVIFDYFTERWIDFNDVISNFPGGMLSREDLTVRRKTLEKRDDEFFYFLNITDFLQPGDNAPYEYVKATVREILINQRKIDFLRKTEDDLYQRALNRGEIIFYNE